MVKKELLTGKKVNYKRVNYAHFFNGINADCNQNILPISYSTNTYNFSFDNGALKTGLGVSTIYLPNSYDITSRTQRRVSSAGFKFKASWLYKKENHNMFGLEDYSYENYIIFQDYLGDFYYFDICNTYDVYVKILNINIPGEATLVNYNLNGEDSILICSVDGMWVFNSKDMTAIKVENAPKIKSMCLHYERLFATVSDDRYEVCFSDDLNPTNWNVSLTEGGFIKFNDNYGIVNKVVSFNDYVYVFREYGISKITAFADQTEFDVSTLFVSSGKIFGNTVCECGDRILMLTQNGIYVFDGYSTTKINLNIDSLLENTMNHFACSCYSNGKYYVACNLNFKDDKKILCENFDYYNNALLELDLQTNTLNILRGVDIRNLNSLADDKVNKVLACYLDNGVYRCGEVSKTGLVKDTNLPKCWQSPLGDFGYPEKLKVVKDIYLKSNVPVLVTIRTERLKKSYYGIPKNDLIHISTFVKGKLIAVDFETDSADCEISNPNILVGLV
ncbi:MAG: hypothetical protein IKB42_02695 [Clostridia bacterium]|nr:hypothetical protein [Clostridia bacterium]